MRLILKSRVARVGLAGLECVIFVLLTSWVGRAYFADVVSRKLTADNIRLATRLDPGDSDLHLKLGRIYQYSLTDIDPTRAIEELTSAVQASPLDAQPWLDLGAAQEVAGHIDEAEASLRRADYLAPRLPGFQWAIANFFLLHGNVDEALRHFRVVLAGTSNYDGIIFSTAWKAVGDGDQILDKVIPDSITPDFHYLYYLVGQKKLPEAQKVWQRIAANPDSFDPHQASPYMDALLASRQPDEAYQVWTDLQKRGLAAQSGEAGNLVSNGDFESEIANFGFGWRIVQSPGVYVGLDSTTFHSGGHSLLIRFSGKDNPYYQGIYHQLRVTPGVSYRARVFMKTDGITTDSGPRLEVLDPNDLKALDVFSDQLTGTNAAWTLLSVNFTPKPNTHFVSICIARLPSQKLDNLISGRVWVDDVSLVEAPPEAPRSAR